jgi:hypothetical protein
MTYKKKAIANYCADWRLEGYQAPLAQLLQVEYVYFLKLAGPDGAWTLPERQVEKTGNIASLRYLDHAAGGVDIAAFVGHTQCAGHQVSDDAHRIAITSAAAEMKREFGRDITVVAIIANRGATDYDWTFEELARY